MSKDVDRNQVLRAIRVRSTVKNDGSWIHRSKDANKEQDPAGKTHALETDPVPVRSSHVLLTARRFESIDPSPSPPLQKAEVIPSEGDSANQASGEIIPALKDTQPEGSTVETKPQASLSKEPIQNFKAQPGKTFPDATAENTEQHADAPADTHHNEGKVSADADVEDAAAEISAVNGTVRESSESKGTAGITGESLIKTEPANATNLEHAGVNMYEPPAMATSGKEASLQGSAETSTVSNVTPKEEAALQNSVISVTDTLLEPSNQETFKSVEFKVKPAEPSEPVFKTGTEEVVESEAQSADNAVAKQSDSTPKRAADHVELNIEDALDLVAASDALDVEPPVAETVPTPMEDPKQPHSEESKLNQNCDDSNTSEMFQKPGEEIKPTQTLNKSRDGKSTCSFCNQIIDGNVKITFSEPPVNCHPDCLKCGVCAKALGHMLTPMFLQDQVIQCGGCFAKAVKI